MVNKLMDHVIEGQFKYMYRLPQNPYVPIVLVYPEKVDFNSASCLTGKH